MSEAYDMILSKLKERILQKHAKYGLSYLDPHCTYHWLLNHRLEGELRELRDALEGWEKLCGYRATAPMNVIDEALDVAICALLIADKKAKEVH